MALICSKLRVAPFRGGFPVSRRARHLTPGNRSVASSKNDSFVPRIYPQAADYARGDIGLQFATTYHDEGFAIVERDGIALHFNVSEGHSVCWISFTTIEALYQHYLPTGAIQSPPPPFQATRWGTKEFWLCDPFRNILIFGEEASTESEG